MAQKSLAPFVVYLASFYIVWSFAWVYGVYPWAVRNIGDTTLLFALINIAFRFAIWVLPVFWYLRRVDGVDPIQYLRLKEHWKRGLVVGFVLSLINLAGNVARFPPSTWHGPYVTWNSILSTSILVGFFEEVPFRGFILQKLEERFSYWTSVVISSALFVGIHLPGWIRLGVLTAYNVAFIFIFGAIMALIFKYAKSLWAPIVAHSLNDFISGVLIHR